MILNFILVALGGALGSVARYSLALIIPRLWLPYGTLTVNAIGSLIIGVAIANISKEHPAYLLAAAGFCGGFTTFSSFSLENIEMIKGGNFSAAALYIIISLTVCLATTLAGTLIRIK